MLKRAVETTWLLLKELDLIHVTVYKDPRLNDRSYGALLSLPLTWPNPDPTRKTLRLALALALALPPALSLPLPYPYPYPYPYPTP